MGFSHALAAYSRHVVQLPRAPSLTVENLSAESAETRRRASPRHRHHCYKSPAASRAEESVKRVRGQATGAVGMPGMDARGEGWTRMDTWLQVDNAREEAQSRCSRTAELPAEAVAVWGTCHGHVCKPQHPLHETFQGNVPRKACQLLRTAARFSSVLVLFRARGRGHG